MCLTFELFILVYSPLCHMWTQSLTIKHLKHLELAMKWSQLFLCRRAWTSNPNPVQDQRHLELEAEVSGSWSSLTLWHFPAFLPLRKRWTLFSLSVSTGGPLSTAGWHRPKDKKQAWETVHGEAQFHLWSMSWQDIQMKVKQETWTEPTREINIDEHCIFQFQTECFKGRQSDGGQLGHWCPNTLKPVPSL